MGVFLNCAISRVHVGVLTWPSKHVLNSHYIHSGPVFHCMVIGHRSLAVICVVGCALFCRNHEVLRGQQQHVTRFIALANVGNPDKKNRVG